MGNKVKDIKKHYFGWQSIKYRPWIFIFISILWTLNHNIPLIHGILVKDFFDIISGNPSLNIGIWGLMGLIMITTVVRIIIIQIGFRMNVLHSFSISTLVRRNILSCIFKKPGCEAIKTSTGEAINSFREDAPTMEEVIHWLTWIIGQIMFCVFALIIMFKTNAKITAFVFIPLIAVIIILKKLEKNIENKREQSRQATANVNGAIGEIFESILTVKVSGSEKSIINNLKKLNSRRHQLMLKDTFFTQLIDSIYSNAVTIGTGVILLLAAQGMRTGNFSVGDFALFVYYFAFVTDTIESIGNFLVFYQQSGVSIKRLIKLTGSKDGREIVEHNKIYLKENEISEDIISNVSREVNGLNTFKVKNLTYNYEGSKNGISDINFSVNKGNVTVICGRTGSGKSTLLKVLLGLISANSGDIFWNEDKVASPKDFFVPPVSAYTPQVPKLFSDTVRNNIFF